MKYIHQCFLFSLLMFSIECFAGQGDSSPDPSTQCFASLREKPELKVLKGKIDMGNPGAQGLDILANTNKPNKVEKVAISRLVSEAEECLHQGEEWREKNMPAPTIYMYDQYIVLTKSLIADLYGGRINYGDFAKQRAAAYVKLKADISEAIQKIVAERKAQQERQAQEVLRQQQERDARQQQNDQQLSVVEANKLNAVKQCIAKSGWLYDNMDAMFARPDQFTLAIKEKVMVWDGSAARYCKQNPSHADMIERQLLSHRQESRTKSLNCQTRASGGQIYTDCY